MKNIIISLFLIISSIPSVNSQNDIKGSWKLSYSTGQTYYYMIGYNLKGKEMENNKYFVMDNNGYMFPLDNEHDIWTLEENKVVFKSEDYTMSGTINGQGDYMSGIAMNNDGKTWEWWAHKLKVSPPPPPPPPPPSEVSEIVEDEDENEVAFAIIENVPVFPGCEIGNNEKKRKCMSDKIAKFIQRKFNTGLAGDLGLTGRQKINIIFKIDKSGNVTGIRARAPHPRLEEEAIRVISLLPKMKPGLQKGRPVIVEYSLPIIFSIQEDKEPQNKNN